MQQLRKVVIIGGCGHVGLPLGIVFANCGLDVVLLDRDQAKIDTVNKGEMPFMETNAMEQLGRVVGKKLTATADPSCLHDSDAANRAMLGDIRIESKGGFELSLEITVKAFLAGYTISETPSTWRDRTAGTSRFKLWKWLPHYLKWYFMAFQPKSRSRHAREELRPT
jgi:hypothetical protein